MSDQCLVCGNTVRPRQVCLYIIYITGIIFEVYTHLCSNTLHTGHARHKLYGMLFQFSLSHETALLSLYLEKHHVQRNYVLRAPTLNSPGRVA